MQIIKTRDRRKNSANNHIEMRRISGVGGGNTINNYEPLYGNKLSNMG